MSYGKNRKKRSGISIKTKVIGWFTAFVVLIALLAIGIVFYVSLAAVRTQTEDVLREKVTEFAEELEWEDGVLSTDDSFYEDDIIFSVYNAEGERILGDVPAAFVKNTMLKNGKAQTISNGEQEWMTYDIALTFGENDVIWVRGIQYTGWVSATEHDVVIIALIVFPLLILLAAVGGYLITRRAFAPVEQIRSTAEKIARSGDLTQRVSADEASGELRELSNTFNHMLDALQQSFENEKQFTSDVSHELRTPVAVMVAQGEYALLEDTSEEERRGAVEVMLGQARKMSGLIGQMLFMARRERGVHEPAEAVDLGMAAEIAAEELAEQAKQKNISIKLHTAPDVYIQADQTGVMRIIVNLIENAIAYGKTDGTVWVSVSRGENGAVLSVRDDGRGIASQHLPHIFKRFYRADAARTADENNHTGLGLSMVKLLAEAYGAAVSVESRAGSGSTFTVRFP